QGFNRRTAGLEILCPRWQVEQGQRAVALAGLEPIEGRLCRDEGLIQLRGPKAAIADFAGKAKVDGLGIGHGATRFHGDNPDLSKWPQDLQSLSAPNGTAGTRRSAAG